MFDSTIVRVETDAGLVGHGEVCPLGPFYLPAYAAGVRAGIAELGPHLIGAGPDRAGAAEPPDGCGPQGASLREVGHRHGLLGHSGPGLGPAGLHAAGRPVWRRLRALSRHLAGVARADGRKVAGYRAEGYRRFQLKVGGEPGHGYRAHPTPCAAVLKPGDRLIADANTGWLMHDAARVVRAVRDVDVYIEQPCLSYEECLSIRRRTDHPFVLDESIDGIDVLLRGHADGAMDVVNLKISKLGGITKLRQARDLCVSHGDRHDHRR